MHQTPLEKRIREVLEPVIEAQGLECVEVAFGSEGGRRLLRVLLDSPHGITLDECAAASRSFGPVLEGLAEMSARYDLEVSSPGINRPLTKPEHFRRFRGERAKLRLADKLDGGLAVTGVLRNLEDDVLEIDTSVGIKRIPLANIVSARLHRDIDAILRAANARPAANEPRRAGPAHEG